MASVQEAPENATDEGDTLGAQRLWREKMDRRKLREEHREAVLSALDEMDDENSCYYNEEIMRRVFPGWTRPGKFDCVALKTDIQTYYAFRPDLSSAQRELVESHRDILTVARWDEPAAKAIVYLTPISNWGEDIPRTVDPYWQEAREWFDELDRAYEQAHHKRALLFAKHTFTVEKKYDDEGEPISVAVRRAEYYEPLIVTGDADFEVEAIKADAAEAKARAEFASRFKTLDFSTPEKDLPRRPPGIGPYHYAVRGPDGTIRYEKDEEAKA